jgi:hypothetical protein
MNDDMTIPAINSIQVVQLKCLPPLIPHWGESPESGLSPCAPADLVTSADPTRSQQLLSRYVCPREQGCHTLAELVL